MNILYIFFMSVKFLTFLHVTRKPLILQRSHLFLFRLQNILGRDPESEDTSKRPTYKGVELLAGWKIVGKEVRHITDDKGRQRKEILMNWEERTIENSFEDASSFATDLAFSLEERLNNCTAEGIKEATFFDIEDTFKVLSGHRLANGHVVVREGELEEHGTTAFKKFFTEICDLPTVQKLEDPNFDPRMSSSVLRDWKRSLRKLIWEKDMTQDLLSCLDPVKGNGIESSLLVDFETSLIKMEPGVEDVHKMETRTLLMFEFANHPPFEAYIKEETVVETLYTNSALYNTAGPVAMTAFDICMAMGGCEAICESFYSVMGTQKQVGQHNSTLEDRTLVDWSMSNVLRSENIIAQAAKLYVDGDPQMKLPRHRVGYLKKKGQNSHKGSQVLSRLKSNDGRYKFLP